MEKFGAAIIGSGGMSAGHAEGFRQMPNEVKIMAFADIDLNKAKERAKQFDAPLAVTDYHDLLKRNDIHIISIVTPPYHHFQTIIDCLQAGKHVLCEKPVVLSLAQLDKIEKKVKETGVQFGGAFQWRFGTSVQMAKDLYDSGMFGKISYASTNLYWHRDQNYFNEDWRHTWTKSGGGIIFTLACHGLDALMHIIGDVDSVSAELDSLNFNIEIEDSGSIILRFKNRAVGHIAATVNAHRQRSRLEIIGTKLEAISGNDPYGVAYEPWEFRSVDQKHENQVREFLKQKKYDYVPVSHNRLIADFVHSISENRAPAVNVKEIRRSLRILTAIYKANRLGEKVYLPILPNDPFYHSMNPD